MARNQRARQADVNVEEVFYRNQLPLTLRKFNVSQLHRVIEEILPNLNVNEFKKYVIDKEGELKKSVFVKHLSELLNRKYANIDELKNIVVYLHLFEVSLNHTKRRWFTFKCTESNRPIRLLDEDELNVRIRREAEKVKKTATIHQHNRDGYKWYLLMLKAQRKYEMIDFVTTPESKNYLFSTKPTSIGVEMLGKSLGYLNISYCRLSGSRVSALSDLLHNKDMRATDKIQVQRVLDKCEKETSKPVIFNGFMLAHSQDRFFDACADELFTDEPPLLSELTVQKNSGDVMVDGKVLVKTTLKCTYQSPNVLQSIKELAKNGNIPKDKFQTWHKIVNCGQNFIDIDTVIAESTTNDQSAATPQPTSRPQRRRNPPRRRNP